MKKWVMIILNVTGFLCCEAQVYWDGEAGDGLWSTSSNWVGNTIPIATDDVVLDNSAYVGNYTVSLPAGNLSFSIRSLTISPAIPNNIVFTIPAGNTSATAFTATGPGEAIVINSGAVILNASGAASGTPLSVTSSNFFRISNGGQYIHRTPRGHTDFLASRLSTAPGTETGIFEFDVPGTASYTITGSNRTYGQLVFSASAAGGPKTYTSSGSSPLQVNGDLRINANTVLSYGSNTNRIIINGNCSIHSNGTFNISNGVNNSKILIKGNLRIDGLVTETGSSLASGIELNGSSTQIISGSGSITQSVQFTMNNPAGAILSMPLKLPKVLNLSNGNIKTSELAPLILADNAICAGGSSLSLVEGPMKKLGDDDFVFPIGKGSIYAPIGISGTNGNPADEFTAEYFRSNPQSATGLGNMVQSPIHHISFVEYWSLVQNNGNSLKSVAMTASEYSFARVLNTLRVARFGGGLWNDEGGTAYTPQVPTPPFITGSFSSSQQLNNYGFFTIGTTDPVFINPLPLHLLSFDALPVDRTSCLIRWNVSESEFYHMGFEILHSTDGNAFRYLASIKVELSRTNYTYTDRNVHAGHNYYRLRVIDSLGGITLSKIISISAPDYRSGLMSVVPGSGQEIIIRYSADKDERWEWIIVDMQGVVILRVKQVVTKGVFLARLPVAGLRAGVYFLFANTSVNRTNALSWVKQ